jgi:hypothetical protein
VIANAEDLHEYPPIWRDASSDVNAVGATPNVCSARNGSHIPIVSVGISTCSGATGRSMRSQRRFLPENAESLTDFEHPEKPVEEELSDDRGLRA